MLWTLLATVNGFEYWTDADGFDSQHADVYRRRVSDSNYNGPDGEPIGARWESKRWHFDRYTAPAE